MLDEPKKDKRTGTFFQLALQDAYQGGLAHMQEQPVEEVYGEEEPQVSSVLDEVLAHYRDDELYRAIRNLPVKQRTVVVFYYFSQMSTKEIAGIMGCMEGTVKSRLYTARTNLKRELTSQQDAGKEAAF